jgi:hypothetical protein
LHAIFCGFTMKKINTLHIASLLAFFFLFTVYVKGQSTEPGGTTTRTYGPPRFGLGVRLGDPSGITLKKYFGRSALELSLGRTYLWNHGRWYDRRFDDWYRDQHFGYRDFQYLGYHSSPPIGVQLHYLIHNGFRRSGENGLEGLTWYYGFGAQFRFQTFYYSYRYKVEGRPDWFYEDGESVTDLDIGADGVIGLEYNFKNAPLSLFADATLFMEVIDDPFIFRLQGGLGLRFNF